MEAVYTIRLQDKFSNPLAKMENKMGGFESKLGGIVKMAKSIGLAFGAVEITRGIMRLGSSIVSMGADMEQTRISFETMLGSSSKANAMIKEIQDFAASTPFQQSEVIDSTKQMLAFGFAQDDVIKQMTRLGDISAGLNVPMGDMVYLYGTLKTQGKAMTKDIMQFAQRGIPIYDALAEVLNVSKSEVGQFVTDGKVGFKEVEKAFEKMTAKGSMFGGLMEKQSKSLSGRFSTFKDQLEIIGTRIGEKLIGPLGKALDKLSSFIELLSQADLSNTFQQYGDAFSGIADIFREIVGLFGISLDKASDLNKIINLLNISLRVSLTPLRIMVEAWKLVIGLVKGVAGMFEKLGKGDFKGIKAIGEQIDKQFSDAFNKEIDGWKNLMGGSTDYSGFKRGSGSQRLGPLAKSESSASGGKSKAKEVGVEKISSGTRNITLNITKLVENITFEKTIEQSEAKMVDLVKRVLLTAVNDVNIAQ